MRTIGVAVAAVAAVVVMVWVGVSAQQQEMLPRPGPGSGIMNVRGTVSIDGLPEVRVVSVPAVSAAGPQFLAKGERYAVTWPSGDTEVVRVLETGQGAGWVRVAAPSGARWVNLGAALAVETR